MRYLYDKAGLFATVLTLLFFTSGINTPVSAQGAADTKASAERQASAEPLAVLDVTIENVSNLLPADAPEDMKGQLQMLRATGVKSARIAILPDADRLVVPVIKLSGDLNTMKLTLTGEDSPLSALAKPGESGSYLLPTNEENPLAMTLHENPDSLVFAPSGMVAAHYDQALASATMVAAKPEQALRAQVNLPAKRNGDWLTPFLQKNHGVMGSDFANPDDIGMIAGFMGDMIESAMRPFDETDAGSISITSLADGHRVVDWSQKLKEESNAKKLTDQFNLVEPAKDRSGRAVARMIKTCKRAKAVQEGNTMHSRLIWHQDDDEMMMKSAQEIWGRISWFGQNPVTPSADEIPTTRIEPVNFDGPYDLEKTKQTIPEALKKAFWPTSKFGRKGERRVNIDSSLEANMFPVDGTFVWKSALTEDGKDIYKKPEGGMFNRIDMVYRHPQINAMSCHYDEAQGVPVKGIAEFTMELPKWIKRVEVPANTPAGSVLKQDGVTIYVDQIENNFAEVEAEIEGGRLYCAEAYNADGVCLEPDGMSGGRVLPSTYKGKIDKIVMYICSEERVETVFESEVPLVIPVMPEEPSAEVATRISQKRAQRFGSYSEEQVNNLTAEWVDDKGGDAGFWIDTGTSGNADKNAKIKISGFMEKEVNDRCDMSVRQQPGGMFIRFYSNEKDEMLSTLKRIDGTATFKIKTGGETVTIKKGEDGASVPLTISGQSGEVVFDKNQVTLTGFDANKPTMIEVLNADGRPLAFEKNGAVWGQVAEATFYATSGEISKEIVLSKKLGEYDEAAFKAHKEVIDRQQEFSKIFSAIRKSSTETDMGSFASLHYLHNESGEPQNIIPIEVAQSDKLSAEKFGYTPKAYKGYFFSFVLSEHDEAFARPSEVTWSGGTYTAPFGKLRKFAAVPVDGSMPTYYYESRMKFKVRGNEPLTKEPEFSDRSWSRMSY